MPNPPETNAGKNDEACWPKKRDKMEKQTTEKITTELSKPSFRFIRNINN